MIIADLIAPVLPWLIGAFAILAAVMSAWFGGQAAQRSKGEADRHEGNATAAKTAKDTRHDLETSDDQRLVDILSGKLHNGKR